MVCLIGLGADGVEVKGDAERRADLVLAAVALADGAGLVIIAHEFLRQLAVELHRGACQDLLFRQRQDRALVRRERRMEMQYGADVVVALLVLTDDLLVIRLAQEGESDAVAAE